MLHTHTYHILHITSVNQVNFQTLSVKAIIHTEFSSYLVVIQDVKVDVIAYQTKVTLGWLAVHSLPMYSNQVTLDIYHTNGVML